MAFFDSDDETKNTVGQVPRTITGDAEAAPSSLYAAVRGSGMSLVSDVGGAVPRTEGPKAIKYADPRDPNVPHVGALGDPWQLDPDPMGDATVAFGQANKDPKANTDIISLNIGGGRMKDRGSLAQTDEGRKLLAIANRRRLGVRRDFFDAMNPLDWGPDKIPFLSFFATVGKSIANGKTVGDTFEKLQKGEPVTDDELIKTSLYINEEREREQGTWGSVVGDIISQAPSFMAEFYASGWLLSLGRKSLSGWLAKHGTEGAAKTLSHVGLTSAQKVFTDEVADRAVKAGIEEYAAKVLKDASAGKMAEAASKFAADSALRKGTIKTVADHLEKMMLSDEATLVTGAKSWSPAVTRKVAEARAEKAVASALAQRTSSSAVSGAMMAAGRAVANSVSRGLMDVGNWGTESSTVWFTDRASAGRSLMEAFNTFFIEAPLKGGELFLMNKALTAPVSAALGGTESRQTLAIKQAAYMNNDDDLMRKAHAIGLGLDLLEYVSENTGRGFKSLMRAGALAVEPALGATARKTAGQVAKAGAKILLEPSETGFVTKGIEFSGLVNPGAEREVGGLISRYVNKVMGKPEDIRATTMADRYAAVTKKLGPDVKVTNVAALEKTISDGVIAEGLDDGVRAAIGNDVNGFVKTALKEAYAGGVEDMKLRCFAQYYIADFMAKHQIGPKTAMDLFEKMGYDGIAGEMLEERYNDVLSGLFGLDAEKDHSFRARIRNAVSGMFPGWDQLTAEAVGFAFLMVARAGTVRVLNAIGGEPAYRRYRENAAMYMDAVRHGTVGQWQLGDLVAGHQRAVDAELAKVRDAEKRRTETEAARPSALNGEVKDMDPETREAREQWDRENLAPIDAEIEKANTAVKRMTDVHKVFMDSLTEEQRGDMETEVAYAPLTAELAEAPAEEYNRTVHALASQARHSLSCAKSLVGGAAEMGQTLYKMQAPVQGDGIGAFRKAAHWIVKAAGAAATGDMGLMSMNPAQWHGADVGLPDGVQDALKDAYGKIYESELSADQRERAVAAGEKGSPHEADIDSAHARALEKFRPIAEQIMAADLAAHQTYMFSDAELKDLAMNDLAKLRDLVPDAERREYVAMDGTRTSFDDFYKEHERFIDIRRKRYAAQAFDLFASGSIQQGRLVFSRRRDDSTVVADVVDIPRDLPTRDQAMLANLLKNIPGMRNILRAHEVDPNKSIDDQLGGMATRQAWLDKISNAALGYEGGSVTAATMKMAMDNADKVNPIVAEAVARDLNFQYDGTEEGLRERNRKIVRVAVLSRALQNPDVRLFSRDGILDGKSRDSAQWSDFRVARRRSDGQWSFRRDDGTEGVASAEALDAEMAKDKWTPTTPRVIFTAAQVLQSSDSGSMISALGLKKRYVSEMENRAKGTAVMVDPLYRKKRDGSYVCTTIEEADALRRKEMALAKTYIDNNRQEQAHLYRRPGDKSIADAQVRLDEARNAYYRVYGDNGYVTVANDILRRNGVTIPMEGREGISVGTLNADLRGKYVISINAFRTRNQSGNVFVPIDHEVSQNYETALLNAVLVDAYFKNRRTLSDIYEGGVRRFVNDVDSIAEAKSRDKDISPALRRNLVEFRKACTFGSRDTDRRMSPQTFALLASAFALYQTEREGNARSNLGDFAPALLAIAADVRATNSFQEFIGAVDRVFGGSGFNSAIVQAEGGVDSTRGIARIFAMFAPTESPSFFDAIEKSAPGGLSAKEFIRRVNDLDTSAWNSAAGRAKKPAAKKPAEQGPVPEGLAATSALQSKMAETGADIDDIIDRVIGPKPEAKAKAKPKPPVSTAPEQDEDDIADRILRRKIARKAELKKALDRGGDSATPEVVDEHKAVSDDVDAIAEAIAERDRSRASVPKATVADDAVADDELPEEDAVEEDVDDTPYFVADNLIQLVDGTETDADSEPKAIEVRDKADLTEKEMKALLPIVGTMCAKVTGKSPNAEEFVRFLSKLAPWIRRRDLQQFTRLFVEGVTDMTEADLEDLWTWAEDDVEEGALPDGYDESNQKSVKALQTKALSNFLALASVVNPHTGRQFQAFVEDLRSTLARSLRDNSHKTALTDEQKNALEFVSRLVNPRADSGKTAVIRDARYAELLDRFTAGERDDEITAVVSALMSGDSPLSRKAAALVGYLACMPPNVRRQMTQLVSSSAPSTPVRVNTDVDRNGKVTFLIETRNGGDSRLSVTAVSAMYASFAGRNKSKCVEAADAIDADAKSMMADGSLSVSDSGDRRAELSKAFGALADIVAAQFGDDCPLVSVLSSKNTIAAIAANDSQFRSIAAGFQTNPRTGAPYIVSTISGGLRYLAEKTKGERVSEEDAALTAVLVNTMGDPKSGGITWQTNTSRTPDRIATLFSVFDSTMPRSIMTAEVNPERSNKPASSVAITMRGVEPALQVFMDREDDSGFRAVCEKFFPEFKALPETLKQKALGVCRQSMCWPVAGRPEIVAKSLSKDAYTRETYAGCETRYELGKMLRVDTEGMEPDEATSAVSEARAKAIEKYGFETVSRFRDDNTLYVPVYSGDHSSSIIVAVPFADKFYKSSSYEEAARTVSKWVGLNLLGVDAKRSALTCLEAPGVGFVGIKKDKDSKAVVSTAEDGTETPTMGECRINIVWSPDGGNEAMLGTTLGTGYGVNQLKKCAKDSKSSTLKFHAMNVASTGKYGVGLSLIKSLVIAMGDASAERGGDFGEYTAIRPLMDFIRKQRSSDFGWSTSLLTDFDSMKLSLANTKMMGVKGAKGKTIPLMEYVFDRIKERLDAGAELEGSYSGAELDNLVGKFAWVDRADSTRSKDEAVISDILDGVRVEKVGDTGMYSLSYADNDIMGFQVANVSHQSKARSREGDYGKTPRNYMIDAFTMAQVLLRGWNADSSLKGGRPVRRKDESRQEFLGRVAEWEANDPLFLDLRSAVSRVENLVSGWGAASVGVSSDPDTVRCLLEDSDDADEAMRHGEADKGRFMRDIIARAVAAHFKKSATIPLHNIAAPLVANIGWVDDNGVVRSHSKSQMFLDTLQGSRTIAKSQRSFYRGHRRMAVCNVNCSDPSFRYGMYLEKSVQDLKTLFSAELGDYQFESSDPDHQAIEIFDVVFTKLRDVEDSCVEQQKELDARDKKEFRETSGAYADWDYVHSLRSRIASCFTDHYGNDLSKRSREYYARTKDKDGNTTRTKCSALWCDEVSYDDLFTRLNLTADGKPTFDRTAFYIGMHRDEKAKGPDGKPIPATSHLYLGGTMFGLPRTPSYNGSQWLQTVRAGLPVTERGTSERWSAGYDAMVAPDPYTLKILGCDHDGDKTNIYMLNAPSRGANLSGNRRRLADSERFLPDDVLESGDFSRYFERRIDRERKLKREWQVSDLGKMLVNNTFVQGLFDMSRAMPLLDNSENEVPFFTGSGINSSSSGGMGFGTMASLVEEKMWKKRFLNNPDVIAAPVLDETDGRTVEDPKTAAKIGDGSKDVADARAIAVSMASAMHVAWASGLFADTLFHASRSADGAKAWIDFMHHLDGFSNMTFDDVKNQSCSRLGITAGMMDTIIADLINHSLLEKGRVPRTDAEFADAFEKYARDVNHGGSRAYMKAATNKGNFNMRQRLADRFGKDPTTFSVANLFGVKLVKGKGWTVSDANAKFASVIAGINSWAADAARSIHVADDAVATAADEVIGGIVRDLTKDFSDTAGYVYWLTDGHASEEEVKDFVRWYLTKSELQTAKAFARSVNYTTVDPGANNASDDAVRRDKAFSRVMYDANGAYSKRAQQIPAERREMLERMHSIVMGAYSLSDNKTLQDYATSALSSYEKDLTDIAGLVADSGAKDDSVLVNFAARAIGAERLRKTDTLQAQANAQMVGFALSAFRTLRQLPGSNISSKNALDVLRAIAEGSVASTRSDGRKAPMLDMMHGIEDMFELMYRIAMSSTVRDTLPIFSYFSERRDSGSRSFNDVDYYGTPEFADERSKSPRSRITLAFQGVTEGQMTAVRELYDRVVGGELDKADSRTDAYTGKKTKFGFTISRESLTALIGAMDTKSAKGTGYKYGPEAKTVKALAKETLSILDHMDAVLGKGTKITPSMMFGQLLPLYAALTTRTDKTPDSRSSSLVTAFGDTYARWSKDLAGLDANPTTARALRMLTGVNWALPNRRLENGDGDPFLRGKGPKRKTRAQFNKAANGLATKLSAEDIDFSSMRKALHPAHQSLTNPRGRYVIDVFGNNELWKAALEMMSDPYVKSGLVEPENPIIPVAPSQGAGEANPLDAESAKDPYVEDLAKRMGMLLKQTNGLEIEYSGGSSFVIKARLGGKSERLGSGVRTAIRVNVFSGEASDERILETVKKRGWRLSVATKAGKSFKEISDWLDSDSTTDAQRIGLYRKYQPLGHTTDDSEWTMSYKKAGVLCREIQLKKQDGDPTVVYHEYFHAMVGMFRDLGVFSDADITALAGKYGKWNIGGREWFNEEKAAYDFQKFVADGTADGKVKNIFAKMLKLIGDLFKTIWKTGLKSSDYGKDMDESPLAMMVLTGNVFDSVADVNPVVINPVEKSVADRLINGEEVPEDDIDAKFLRHVRRKRKVNAATKAEAEAPKDSDRAEPSVFDSADDIDDKFLRAVKRKARKVAARVSEDFHQVERDRFEAEGVSEGATRLWTTLVADTVSRGSARTESDVIREVIEGLQRMTSNGDKQLSDSITKAWCAACIVHPAEFKAVTGSDMPFAVAGEKAGDTALNTLFPDRMNGNYSQFDTIARAVGMAVRNGLRENGLDEEAASVLASYSRLGKVALAAEQKAAAEEAIRQVASVYGLDLGKGRKAKGSKHLRSLVFRAMVDISAGVKKYSRTDGGSGGPVAENHALVTSSDLASALMASCGMAPRNIATGALNSLRKYADTYRDTSMGKVIERCEKALSAIESSDQTQLCTNPEQQEALIGAAIHDLQAGLDGGMGGKDYGLGEIGTSKNKSHDSNIKMYAEHIGNADFHSVMHLTLDTMYMTLAGMKFYRQMGFEPGDAAGTLIDPPKAECKTPDETAARLGVEARQMLDRDFDAIEYMDQPAFVANNIEAYLESTVRKTFGKMPIGEIMQGLHNKAAGYVLRLNNAENWLAALLGQNVLPHQRIHEASIVDGKFAMEGGAVVAKAGGKHVKFELYRGKRTKVSLTEDEHRLVDLVLKADKAFYQGARNVVTGVDDISFSRNDSDDPTHYSEENLRKRVDAHEKLSAIDIALLRLSDSDAPQLPGFVTGGKYNLREKFVNAVCDALRETKKSATASQSDQYFSSSVLTKLESAGILVAHETNVTGTKERVRDRGTLVIPVRDIEEMFQSSTALDKLVAARRNLAEKEEDVRAMFSRENRIRPLHNIYREFSEFVAANPWLTDGDGAFFNNMKTPLAFVRGTGMFMYNANRKVRDDAKSAAADKVTQEEEKFIGMIKSMGENGYAGKSLAEVTGDQLRYLRDLYGTYEDTADALRMAIRDGKYAPGSEGSRRTGLVLPASSGMYEVTLAIYNRLVEAMWRENGDPVVARFGGKGNVQRMIEACNSLREKSQELTGGAGLTDEMAFRINGMLPANHQLGHAIHNQMEGIVNALMFRSALVNMLMTPDAKGRPTVYANPNAVAAEASGIPDEVWGTIARWWADTNPLSGARYDESKSGVENASAIYSRLHDKFVANGKALEYEGDEPGKPDRVGYGEINGEDIDAKSISGVMAQTDVRDAKLNFLGGGYALGYAKHLLQASRHLGSSAQRAIIHRTLGWSKSMSVSFSFFFPLATKYESPWGAVGAMAMLGSNHFSETMRKNPEVFNAIQKAFGGSGWITQDFLGFKDVIEMMDSDDPFLAELVSWASALGVSLSDSRINPVEPQRSIVQRDLAKLREMVRDRMGAKAAARFDSVTRALLLRTGDKAFTYALNATKLATVAQLCMKLRHEAEKKGLAFDPVRDLKRYSGYINAEIGGIDPLKYAWAHPMNRGLMSMLMFSWEWTRGAWEAGGGGVIEDFLFGGHNVTAEERKYIVGRWARMFGGVMIGVPLMFQILVKALAKALGHDDDTEKWFTWQNEDKAMWTAFDITPLMKAMSERFPTLAQWKKDHPALGALLPMYTGSDRANSKFGSLNEKGETTGRHYYMHFGKQGWEEFRWFTDPSGQFFSKLSMPVQRMLEGVFGRSLSWLDHELPWSDMSFAERWLNPSLDSATANLVKAFMPFTLTGVIDRGDAGLLSAFGPVQMGASATATQDKIVKILRDWAYNDRSGYRPANPVKGKFAPTITSLNSSVSSLVREAMTNGASYSDALTIVGTAVGRLTASLYGELLDALPDTPGGDFDAVRVSKCVRAINRLGRKRKDVVAAIKKRLEQRHTKIGGEKARKWTEIFNASFADPYSPMEVK